LLQHKHAFPSSVKVNHFRTLRQKLLSVAVLSEIRTYAKFLS